MKSPSNRKPVVGLAFKESSIDTEKDHIYALLAAIDGQARADMVSAITHDNEYAYRQIDCEMRILFENNVDHYNAFIKSCWKEAERTMK